MPESLKKLFLVIAFFLPTIAQPQTITLKGEVTYIAGGSYFTNIGKDAGAAKGDTLYNLNKKPILVIESISRKSSFCKTVNSEIKINIGTKVMAYVLPAVASEPSKSFVRKDTVTVVADQARIWEGSFDQIKTDSSTANVRPILRTASRKANQVSGRVALQSLIMNDRLNGNNDYQQPGGLINLHVYRIQDKYFDLNVNARFRKTYSKRAMTGDNYPMRIYEISLVYNNPAVPYSFAAGRVFSPVINGVGNFDGGVFEYRLADHWQIGAFGGTQPDYLNSKPDWSHSKGGMYVHYKNEMSPDWRWTATLAFAGQYVKGKIDREYFYVQNDAAIGPKLYAYMSSEIGVNRSDLSARKKAIELSNLYVLGRYKPFKPLTISISYDARVNVYLLQSYRAIPDSLFDDAYRQGFRGDVHWRATRQLAVTFSSSVRTRAGDPNSTYLNSGGLYYYNLFKTRVNINCNIFFATTSFTKANSLSFGLFRQFSDLYLSTTYRTYRYQYVSQGTHYRRQSITFDGSYAFTRKIFVTAGYENSSGKNEKSTRIFTELSYRF